MAQLMPHIQQEQDYENPEVQALVKSIING
jgi:hypothetical protein